MEVIMQSLVIVAMFALRLLGPVVVVLALAYVLKGLDRHWQAQAEAERRKSGEAEEPAVQPTAPQPGTPAPRRPGRDMPGPQLPYDPTGRRPLPGVVAAPVQPCWEQKGCTEAAKAQCAAPAHPEQPCWQARFQAEEHIPAGCLECERFDMAPLERPDEKQTRLPLWRERND